MSENQDLAQLAKDIISTNQYMTIASVDSKGVPWASALCYAYDSNYNFYWVSLPSSKHQSNISNNSEVSFAIFDSHQDWGEGDGIQGNATVEKVALSEIVHAQTTFFTRDYPYGKKKCSFRIR